MRRVQITRVVFIIAFIITCREVTSQVIPPNVPQAGLVAWYPFNGNANDESVNNNNGIVTGAALTTDRFGKPDSAYYFDGQNDFIEVLWPHEFDFNANESFTLNVWISPDSLDSSLPVGQSQRIFWKYSCPYSSIMDELGIQFTDAPIFRNRGNNHNIGVYNPLPTLCKQWFMLTYVKDAVNDSLITFIDGVRTSATSIPSFAHDHQIPFEFGATRFCGGLNNLQPVYFFKGKIDDGAIWNRTLSEIEIFNMYDYFYQVDFEFDLNITQFCTGDSSLVSIDSTINGTPPFHYDWSNGDSTQHVFLPRGTYSVTVSDSLGCSKADTFEVSGRSFDLDLDSTHFCLFDSVWVRTTDTSGSYVKSWLVTTPDSAFNFQGDSLPIILQSPGIYRFEIAFSDSACSDSLIREFTVDSIPQIVFVPDDSVFCDFDTLLVDTSNSGGYSYVWSTGDSGYYTLVEDTGFFSVTLTSSNGCSYADSTYVKELRRFNFNLPADTFLCAGDILILNIPGIFDSVIWNDGDTNFTKNIDSADLFIAEVTNSCGVLTDSVWVDYVIPPKSLKFNDTVICAFDSIVVDLESNAGDSVLWQDGTTTARRVFYDSEVYSYKVSNRCGIQTDSIRVTFADTPVIYIEDDLEICEQEEVYRVELFLENSYDYRWSTGAEESQISISDSGFYAVTVTNEMGCEGIYNFEVGLCPFEVFVPNVITPNGDGINDGFAVKGLRGKEFSLLIYNRWGILLFDNKGFAQEWDARVNGKQASSGTYFYVVEYMNEITNRREVKKGSFMLLTD